MKAPTKAELYAKIKELEATIAAKPNDHINVNFCGFLWQGSYTNLQKFLESGHYDTLSKNVLAKEYCS